MELLWSHLTQSYLILSDRLLGSSFPEAWSRNLPSRFAHARLPFILLRPEGMRVEESYPPLSIAMNAQDRSSVSSEQNDHKVDLGPDHQPREAVPKQFDEDIEQNPGVARVEALHRHLSGGWVWMLYISIGALAYVYALDQNTTSNYLPLATSSFGQHSFIGTIGTAEGIISRSFASPREVHALNLLSAAVGKPCIAKIADLSSRPFAYIVVRKSTLFTRHTKSLTDHP